jgi:hypothetical protein
MSLTGKTIGELTELSAITETTLFPVEFSGETFYVPYSSITTNIKPYKVCTALLLQSLNGSGFDTINSGNTVIGVTYQIDASVAGDDFRDIGGPLITYDSEFIDYYFLATGTTPTNWTNGTVLRFNTGAPTVIVLENTIGIEPFFRYLDIGTYKMEFYGLYPYGVGYNKTAVFYTNRYDIQYLPLIQISQGSYETNEFNITASFSVSGGPFTAGQKYDAILNGTIEIRVYN